MVYGKFATPAESCSHYGGVSWERCYFWDCSHCDHTIKFELNDKTFLRKCLIYMSRTELQFLSNWACCSLICCGNQRQETRLCLINNTIIRYTGALQVSWLVVSCLSQQRCETFRDIFPPLDCENITCLFLSYQLPINDLSVHCYYRDKYKPHYLLTNYFPTIESCSYRLHKALVNVE